MLKTTELVEYTGGNAGVAGATVTINGTQPARLLPLSRRHHDRLSRNAVCWWERWWHGQRVDK